jgi:hypothetical protein
MENAIKFPVGENEFFVIYDDQSWFILHYINKDEFSSEFRNITNFSELLTAIRDIKERYNIDLKLEKEYMDENKYILTFRTSDDYTISIYKHLDWSFWVSLYNDLEEEDDKKELNLIDSRMFSTFHNLMSWIIEFREENDVDLN